MKVKLRTQYAGPNGAHSVGAVVDFDKAEAYRLIEGGYAEQIAEPAKEGVVISSDPAVETADLLTQRTAEAPANKRPRRLG